MIVLYDIISNKGGLLANPKYNLRNKQNILGSTEELMGKLIILTSGKIGETKMIDVTFKNW